MVFLFSGYCAASIVPEAGTAVFELKHEASIYLRKYYRLYGTLVPMDPLDPLESLGVAQSHRTVVFTIRSPNRTSNRPLQVMTTIADNTRKAIIDTVNFYLYSKNMLDS